MRCFAYSSLLALTLVACGGDATDGGTGSDTLYIDADVVAEPQISNARDAGDFTTELRVRCSLNGADLNAGTVVLHSEGGDVDLAWDGSDWRAAQSGYWGTYTLDVDFGDDYVHGVTVDGPGIHYFTAPAAGATVDATAPLEVTWDRGSEADSASIETQEMSRVAIADSGSFLVPVGGLKSSTDQVEDEQIEVRRASRVAPAGAVGGSELRVSIRNEIDVVVAATGI